MFTITLLVTGCQARITFSTSTQSKVPTGNKTAEGLSQDALVELGKLIDGEKARTMADQVAKYLCGENQELLYEMMEKAFRDSIPNEQFSKTMQGLFSVYGKPITADYKQVEYGKKFTSGSWKPLHTYWYAVQTSKHPKGTHFLIVQIILEEKELAVSSMQIVTFPLGKIPPMLQ
ncbi:MAG: hypothetical protein QM703_24875 [Gemmatales bacterium]